MGSGPRHPAPAFIFFTPDRSPIPGTRAFWLHLSAFSCDFPTLISDRVPIRLLRDPVPSLSSAISRVGGGRYGVGAPGPVGLRLLSVGSPVPLPAASRNLSGSLTLLPLPTLFQGGVCGVETRTRLEEELYNREKPGKTSGDEHRQLERSQGRCKQHQGKWGRNIMCEKDFGFLVHITE